jgi:signal transduction histidine kinase
MSEKDKIIQSYLELSQFAHTLRHDIRNFLAAIEGYAYLLNDEFNVDYLERIKKNTKLIGKIIDKSVEYADSGLRIDADLDVDLNQVVNGCRELIPDAVTLEIDPLRTVKGNHVKIMQIFEIIIKNAIDHGKHTKNIRIKEINSEGFFILQICNDGEPITPELEKKLFSSPQTFKNNQSFGLNMAKKLSEAHGWVLRYNNSIKDSTCFELVIPQHS